MVEDNTRSARLTNPDLEPHSVGFRDRYVSYADLKKQVKAWEAAFPGVVHVQSIGRSPEGRELWLLTIGPEPNRIRPAVWIDANMHAGEVTGTSVALAIAEDALQLHVNEGDAPHDLPAHLRQLIKDDVLLYVLPRMAPDGAEVGLTLGRFVRSNVRDNRTGRTEPYWRAQDIDGDGLSRVMRRVDPAGDFVVSDEVPGLMLPRRVEDPGPYYALYAEGTIENWDGFTIPQSTMMSDMETDLNRNFSSVWRGEPHQLGAGPYALSEPESLAVTEFAVAHPNIFAWMNLHTFGGVVIRPAGDKTDKKMDQSDLAVFHQLEEWAQLYTDYPTVSGFEEFTYEPDKPLCGDLSNWAYEERGTVAFVVELWDFFKQSGLTVHRPFVMNYLRRTRQDCVTIAKWDKEHNKGRVVGEWKPFEHPQLGALEIGGYDPRFGMWNPPPERLHELCAAQAKVLFRLAGLAPRVAIDDVTTEKIGADLVRISAVVENRGYLPTYVLSSAKGLTLNQPMSASLTLSEGQRLVSGELRESIGHLEGWGGHHKPFTPMLARSVGVPVRKKVEWVVQGTGVATIEVSGLRVGAVHKEVDL